ncbi:MAG: MBL fold metallo-hydrolase [Alphaproteobacteria bacterium]
MQTIALGAFTVTRIEEMLTPGFDPGFLFPAYDEAILTRNPDLAEPNFLDPASRRLMSSMHSWLIRTDRHVILVDTGCGNHKERHTPGFERFHMLDKPYLRHLAEAGVRPEDVTLVINTHLHIDHVGWNTQLVDGRWVPTFPNARYIYGAQEFKHWRSPDGGLVGMPGNGPVMEDSVMPVWEAGQVDLIEDGDRILDGLSVELAPGHTPGQMFVRLESDRHAAYFTGDCLHQPMQVCRPDWNSRFCEDQAQAVATRRRLLDHAADRNALVFPAHFGAPHTGYVRRTGEDFRFEPLTDAA